MARGEAMLWLLIRAIIGCAAIFTVLVILLIVFQERLIFYPNAMVGYETPGKNPIGLRHPGEQRFDYEDVAIKTPDGPVLHAWLIRPEGPPRATIMFFQGNAGNMGFRLLSLGDLVRAGFTVIAVSYRGYGYSQGTPNEAGVTIDAQAALDYFHNSSHKGVDLNKLFIFGRSIGGAVAIRVAHDNPDKVAGVMAENTFKCMESMAMQAFPFLRPMPAVVRAVLKANFRSIDLVPRMTATPLLLISGAEDTLIPPEHSATLFALSGSPLKWLVKIAMGTHNDTWQKFPREYREAIQDWVTAAIKYKEDPSSISKEDAARTMYVPKLAPGETITDASTEGNARAVFSWGRTWERMPGAVTVEEKPGQEGKKNDGS